MQVLQVPRGEGGRRLGAFATDCVLRVHHAGDDVARRVQFFRQVMDMEGEQRANGKQ